MCGPKVVVNIGMCTVGILSGALAQGTRSFWCGLAQDRTLNMRSHKLQFASSLFDLPADKGCKAPSQDRPLIQMFHL